MLLLALPAQAQEFVGRAVVVDADTLDIHGQRIRLDAVDAPESWQTCLNRDNQPYRCGKTAVEALDAFLAASRPTTCRQVSRDRYGRAVAVCVRADGVEVNAWLVRNGFALDWRRYSSGRYAREQDRAKSEKRGLWQGWFMEPWKARKLRPSN